MKSVETSEKISKETLIEHVNRILDKQNEIAGVKKELDVALQGAEKQTYPKGEVVSFENLIEVKGIANTLSVKSEENKRLILDLYNSIFPDDIFISQDYFEVWVKIDSKKVIKFDYDFYNLEVSSLEELI